MKHFFTGVACLLTCAANAQDTTEKEAPPLHLSAYVEAYYSYDFNLPANGTKASFLYNYNRHNEINLNLGFVKLAYAKDRVRTNLAVAAGTYMNANYSAEPGVLKNVYEANVGYRLSKKGNLWFDMGVLPSHIGFESAAGKDNWTLTRSLAAENSPYFESGARLSYTTKNDKWLLSVLALNGWQRITKVEGNSLLSWGTQINYTTSSKTVLNYSTFIGTDQPDSTRTWRIFHDLYSQFYINTHLGITTGFDIGTEQQQKGSAAFYVWYAPVIIVRYSSDKWAIAARGEYYNDKNSVLISSPNESGFRTAGLSLNADFIPNKTFLMRLEGRTFLSPGDVFVKGNTTVNHATSITFSMGVSL